MRKIKLIISIFTLAVLCIHQNVHASISAIAEHEIVRINENMFIGKKRIPYKNRDGSINEEGDDVYFVLEKLTPKNHEFWINYNAEQHRQTLRSGAIADRNDGSGNKKTVSVGDGIGSFKVSLELLPALRSDIWIAYATRKNPTPFPDPGYRDDIPWNESDWPADKREEYSEYEEKRRQFRASQIEMSDIEMTFSVFLNAESPITTHMGISRNYEYFLNKERPHISLAMELHAFSAKASQHIYGPKSYMVTNPATEMRSIMLKSFERSGLSNYIWVGDTKHRTEHKNGDRKGYADADFLYPADPSAVSPFDNRDPQKWTITLRDESVIAFQRPDWFKHRDLLNHLPTAIIELEALSSLWDRPVA